MFNLFILSLILHCGTQFHCLVNHDNNAKYQASTTSTGIISTVAGSMLQYKGKYDDGIAATSAIFAGPQGLALDKDGNFYIATESKIRKITASTGIITTVAGTRFSGSSGDGGQASLALINGPSGLCLDISGNIFIADSGNHRIRKITLSTGVITTVAGNGQKGGSGGDNMAATNTTLDTPMDVAVDLSGNIFIADYYNDRIRMVTAGTGIITTIAGCAFKINAANIGITTAATEVYIRTPIGVTLDTSGNVYIAGGYLDNCIFKVTVSTGYMSIVAGQGQFGFLNDSSGYNGDNILATKAKLFTPFKVAFDSSSNMFISDSRNYRVRKVTASTGMITTIAGTGARGLAAGDNEGGAATSTPIGMPYGIAVDALGNFYYTDSQFHVVSKVTYTEVSPSASVTSAPSVTRAPSSSVASTPTVSSSISKAPVVTPSASTSTSAAPATSSTTGQQGSAATHVVEALHVTVILLISILILHSCRDA